MMLFRHLFCVFLLSYSVVWAFPTPVSTQVFDSILETTLKNPDPKSPTTVTLAAVVKSLLDQGFKIDSSLTKVNQISGHSYYSEFYLINPEEKKEHVKIKIHEVMFTVNGSGLIITPELIINPLIQKSYVFRYEVERAVFGVLY